MSIDPYAELDVPRDAPAEAVKRAYKRKAKQAHPDGGGSAAAFARLQRCFLVLRDPAKRARYDATGDLEEERPDNTRAGALQVVDAFLSAAIEAYMANFEPALDPRRRDLVEELKEKLRNDISNLAAQEIQMKKGIAFVEDFAWRIAGGDKARPVERSLERRLAFYREQLRANAEQREVRRVALVIAGTYAFAHDPQPYRPVNMTTPTAYSTSASTA